MARRIKRISVILYCLLLFGLNTIYAQRAEAPPLNKDSTLTDSLPQGSAISDTLPVFLFAERQRLQLFRIQDSALYVRELLYDPARIKGHPQIQLGNLGSPTTALNAVHTFAERPKGLYIGLQAFKTYHYTADSLYFYRRQKAFTEAAFSQGPSQEDLMINLKFGRSFGQSWHFATHFRRINNTGYFQHIKSFADALVAGMYHHRPGGRYYGIAYFVHNENRQQDNGGIEAEATDLFGNTVVAPPQQLNINTPQAATRLADNRYVYSQYYRLSANADSTALPHLSNGWFVQARTRFSTFEYKFYDDENTLNSTVYGPLLNERGMRLFLRNTGIEQQFNIIELQQRSDSTGRREVVLGASYQYNRLRQEPEDTTLGLSYLHTQGLWQSTKQPLSIQWKAFYALKGEPDAYMVQFHLSLANWQVGLLASARQPAQISRRMYLTQQLVWDRDFPNETLLQVQFSSGLPEDRIKLTLSLSRLQNAIYYDTTFLPQQIFTPVQIAEVLLESRLQWWKFHYRQSSRMNLSTHTQLPLPGLYSEQCFYFKDQFFKGAFELILGSELILFSPYKLRGYQQATGVFYQTDKSEDWQFLLNAFLGGRIKNIHLYFSMENLLPPLTGRYYYLVYPFPQPQLALRFGISATFRN